MHLYELFNERRRCVLMWPANTSEQKVIIYTVFANRPKTWGGLIFSESTAMVGQDISPCNLPLLGATAEFRLYYLPKIRFVVARIIMSREQESALSELFVKRPPHTHKHKLR